VTGLLISTLRKIHYSTPFPPPRLEQGQGLEVSYVETVDVVTLDTIIDRQRALVNERRPILKMGTQGLGSECV
jgi:hypothetical protein